jgi:hypothetical protein
MRKNEKTELDYLQERRDNGEDVQKSIDWYFGFGVGKTNRKTKKERKKERRRLKYMEREEELF